MKQMLLALLLLICVGSYFFPGRYFTPSLTQRFSRKLPNSLDHWRELASQSDRDTLSQLDGTLRNQPLEILKQLAYHQIQIQPELQNWLAYEALENLARILNGDMNRLKALAILQHAQGLAGRLKAKCEIIPDLILSLRMEIDGNRQRGGLRKVAGHFENQQYDQAVGLAKELCNGHGPPGQMRSALEKTIRAIQGREAMGHLEKALELERAATEPSGDLTSAWRKLQPWNLPQELQHAAATLRGTRLFEAIFSARWDSSPETKDLKQILDDFRHGNGDGLLSVQIQENLAIKALFEGYPKVALDLLPEYGDSGHAKKLLTDFNTLIEGSGGALSTLAEAVGTTPGASSKPFPGLLPILGPHRTSDRMTTEISPANGILKKNQERIPILLKALENDQNEALKNVQEQLDRAGESLNGALIQANLDDDDNLQWINKLNSKRSAPLTPVQRAIALELKREKLTMEDAEKYLRNLPNYLNEIDRR